MGTRLQRGIKATLIGGWIAISSCTLGVSVADTEIEPNDLKAQAQVLVMPADGLTVSASIGSSTSSMTTDLDLYAFEAKAGDIPVISVVSDGAWDTFVGLYDSVGNLLEMNDDAYPMNTGSVSPFDSRIDTYRIAADDTYYIAVTPIPRYLGANYSVINTSATMGGAYELSIQGVSPTATDSGETPAPSTPSIPPVSSDRDARVVTIEVRHFSRDDDEPENRRFRKLIPVAILSSPDFGATDIDPDSLTFGATGTEDSLARCRRKGKDVNRDGLKDLICYFRTELTGFDVGDVQAFLNGATENGEAIEGSAALKVYSISKKKRESWHERHKVDPRDDKRKHRKNRGKNKYKNR